MPTFLLEVGTEELPAAFVTSAIAQLQTSVPQSLDARFLTSEAIAVYGTPRRLAVSISGLPAKQPDRAEEIKGPPAKAAFKEGKPTKAAEGFARKQGVALDALELRDTDKGEFVFINKIAIGQPTKDVLAALVPEWIGSLEGKRFMCWGDGDLRFSRPIRWLVALLDRDVLPIALTNGSETVRSDRFTQGHRVLSPQPLTIPHADAYVEVLAKARIVVEPARRRTTIARDVQEAAATKGGHAIVYDDLLAEVSELVEAPSIALGGFDEQFLELPVEVATTEMIAHQRYFPVWKDASATELLPYFITVSNGDPTKADIIAAGNARVLRARLADGQFFFDRDRQQSLEAFVPKLDAVTFQADLGSVGAKVGRVRAVAGWIATQLALSAGDRALVDRAALLCKADLVTQMVGEFPELQGIMGEKYARASSEPEAVAVAIAEHYLPRGATDGLPQTTVGRVVGIADRLDTLVGIFGVGLLPSGSSDPFALRRAGNAIVAIVWDGLLPLDLSDLLQRGVTQFEEAFGQGDRTSGLLDQLQDFFVQRVRSLLGEAIDYDLIDALLGNEADREYRDRALNDLPDLQARARFLQTIRRNGRLDAIYETVNRSARLAEKGDLDLQTLDPSAIVSPARFEKASEQEVFDGLVTLLPQTETARAERNYQLLVDGLIALAPAVGRFFDGPDSVLVMDEDEAVRRNRLNLLGAIRNHARVLADFGAIVKPG
ncbi:glycyl-tRNA synthetase, tetrameric type, beta subunit [Rubidibacter lacunae KORDI 51-2]|uniref:Glycine--tRNA ligase beta subunit n=1 Tax=Rubidibacter lacunae KORDI 51-2 TaxID=582515 RepID=U5DFX6_9CHRO|nr:glycine--tRNA ligase subunit beta [Rubidibacter lacunae]ERN40501.1 glycyl-tRNA synthetase, tetrameric type, beta subunit [Rubidibacter lacunae KORDI 51-2]